jgi:hypothetical protein
MRLEQERLPYSEGWRPPWQQIDGLTLVTTVLQLALATPEKTYPANMVFGINQAYESPFLGSMERPPFYGHGIQQNIIHG